MKKKIVEKEVKREVVEIELNINFTFEIEKEYNCNKVCEHKGCYEEAEFKIDMGKTILDENKFIEKTCATHKNSIGDVSGR